MTQIFDQTFCSLGEGPLWHPLRQSLFWFDINAFTLFEKSPDAAPSQQPQRWQFDTFVSAAGWIDETTLLIAKKGALITFDLDTQRQTDVADLEPDQAQTRPNDGRADPLGGFWIGTMGINLEQNAGAIYRYYRGELRKLYSDWTIPNATCFSPCARWAYITDTPQALILRISLDENGWPDGAPAVIADMSQGDFRPDGAVVDCDGRMWIAHYGYAKVTVLNPDGTPHYVIALAADQPTCPAFGGPDRRSLFVTSAGQSKAHPDVADGRVLRVETQTHGQAEHRVIL